MSANLHPIFREIVEKTFTKSEEPFQDDATKHYDRTDPGQSLPGECVHSWFQIGTSCLCRFKCSHCGIISVWEP